MFLNILYTGPLKTREVFEELHLAAQVFKQDGFKASLALPPFRNHSIPNALSFVFVFKCTDLYPTL